MIFSNGGNRKGRIDDAQQRRGRRPAGSGTREAILEAARQQFGELGYRHTTLRSVAAEAAWTPAWCCTTSARSGELFIESVELPVDPDWLVDRVFVPSETSVGQRAAEALLSVSLRTRDTADGGGAHPCGGRGAGSRAAHPRGADRAHPATARRPRRQRPAAAARQPGGLPVRGYRHGPLRRQIEPLASATREQLVRALGPVYDHYLSGAWTEEELPSPAARPASGSPS